MVCWGSDEWGVRRTPPSLATPVGPLPRPVEAPRPLSATSALRRHQPAGMRKKQSFAEGFASGLDRPEAETPKRPFKPTGYDDGIADSGRSGVDAPSSGTP